ncbi:MAG: RNA polymerase sigma-70 factor [Parabacteroides sp.]
MNVDQTDEILLMRLIQTGDQTAFRYLFYKYVDSLERFIICLVHDREVARELVLDIFTYLWEHRETFQIRLTLKAYLFQSARNNALSYLRDKRKTLYIEELQLSDDGPVDSSLVELEELHQLIAEAVCQLPGRCQEIFRMSREQDMTNKEIAHSLDLSEKTVEAQITIALRKIRAFLGDSYSYLW